MKRMIMTIVAILTMTVSADAMSYEQARNEALFLTDKMAYELNLSDSQYEAAYEINLDYLMGVTSRDDVYGTYWTRRNADFGYILLDWQWKAFCAASYFYRPLYWNAGYWHFGIYARYPRRDYFYFSRPAIYISYRGGHSWRSNGGRSYYQARRADYHPRNGVNHIGMRDRWNNGSTGKRGNGINSSTRVTVNNSHNNGTRPSATGSSKTSGTFGGNRTHTGNTSGTTTSRPSTGPATTTRPATSGNKTGGSFGTTRTTNTGLTTRITPSRAGTSSTGTATGSTSTRTVSPAVRSTTGTAAPKSAGTTSVRSTGAFSKSSAGTTAVRSSAGTSSRPSIGTQQNRGTRPSASGSSSGNSRASGSFGGRR